MHLAYKIFLMTIFPIVFILPQKDSKLRTHNFSGNTLVSVSGIFTLGYSDYSNGKINFGAAGMAEYFIPTYSPTIFGLSLLFGGQTVSGKDKFKDPTEFMTDMYILGGGLTLGYTFDNEFFPYVYGGVSNLWFSPKNKNGKRLLNNSLNAYSRSSIAYDAEFGSRIVLHDRLSMFFGVGIHFVQTDNFDDITAGENDDFYYSGRIGVSFAIFGRKDSDGDGILDSDDACPSNPEDYDGFQDEDGCPDHDNDKDGIWDEKDKCPNEAEDFDGYQDDDGCPDLDNDNDGIPDSKDLCPNQAENYNGYEDEDGCPDILSNVKNEMDRDKDGIPDDIDKCPDQAETFNGFQDDDGCPDILSNVKNEMDRDKDGIPDSIDKCPDQAETFNSFQDDDGCPDSVEVSDTISVKEIMLEGIKLFDYRGSEIKPTAYEELNKTAEFLSNDPFIKWAVEGYTDNNGVQDSLKLLSLERARTVVRYLINKGLPSFMFKVYGKGSELPITENNTLEGRLKNNRIVIRRLD